MSIKHETYEKLKRKIGLRLNVYMVGPAGSGKTTGAEQVAEDLGLPFYAMSVCAQTTKADLMGYKDVSGVYHETVFYQAYANGGVFLLDEVDNGNANVLNSLNAATANNIASFPCGMVKKSPDFICVAAGNTYGMGATKTYVGRQALDGATLNRFTMVEWAYDERVEDSMVSNIEVAKLVQAIRKSVENLGIKIIVSPRSSAGIDKEIASGVTDINCLLEEHIWKGQVDAATIEKIMSAESVVTAIKKIEPPKPVKQTPADIANALMQSVTLVTIGGQSIEPMQWTPAPEPIAPPASVPAPKKQGRKRGPYKMSAEGSRALAENMRRVQAARKLARMGLLP